MLQSTERRRPVSGLLVKCCKLKPSQHNVPVSGKWRDNFLFELFKLLDSSLHLNKGIIHLFVRNIFQKIFISLRTCTYQGVRNGSSLEKFACKLNEWPQIYLICTCFRYSTPVPLLFLLPSRSSLNDENHGNFHSWYMTGAVIKLFRSSTGVWSGLQINWSHTLGRPNWHHVPPRAAFLWYQFFLLQEIICKCSINYIVFVSNLSSISDCLFHQPIRIQSSYKN